MTKYAKCTVCGYVIAIPDDKSPDDYICPNDGNTLVEATEDEYNAAHAGGGVTKLSQLTIDETGRITIAQPLVLDTGRTWTIPANHHVTLVLGPGQSLSGSDTITGEGSFILLEM